MVIYEGFKCENANTSLHLDIDSPVRRVLLERPAALASAALSVHNASLAVAYICRPA